ncbi:unnamed protein product [Cuscuta campestris]|uniref:Uncharacterized protein n=1 Tax=Cuscuta campestris TaxID=132261 RepID=A0A484LL33_9ASTE|nr:unnamed protein product [Cuscuta campestris]
MAELRLTCDAGLPAVQRRVDAVSVSFRKSLETTKSRVQETVLLQGISLPAMVSKPGLLTDWPWTPLCSFKVYILLCFFPLLLFFNFIFNFGYNVFLFSFTLLI